MLSATRERSTGQFVFAVSGPLSEPAINALLMAIELVKPEVAIMIDLSRATLPDEAGWLLLASAIARRKGNVFFRGTARSLCARGEHSAVPAAAPNDSAGATAYVS